MTNVNWTAKTGLYITAIALCTLLTYIPAIFPISLIRLVFYGIIAYAVYCKTQSSDKKWIMALPICAGIIDVVPVLSLIPFVPTALNFAGIILSFALTTPQALNKHHGEITHKTEDKMAA